MHSHLEKLPDDVLDLVGKYAKQPTARFFAPVTQREEIIRKYSVVQPFLNNVLKANDEAVYASLANDKSLLFATAPAVNYSGQSFENWTALQLAWGARDYEMCLKIVEFFEQDPNGLASARSQLNAKFPHEEMDIPTYDFNELIQAFQSNQRVRDALTKFKNDFAPRNIEAGYHFNVHNLDRACFVYDHDLAALPMTLRDIFLCEVIGYLQRLVPACLAQALRYGLHHLAEAGDKPLRKFDIGDSVYYPLDTRLYYRLGYNAAVYSDAKSMFIHTLPGHAQIPSTDEGISKLMKYHLYNEIQFAELRRHINGQVKRKFCSIL